MARTKGRARWQNRLSRVRRPRDASTDFDDTAYDGGVSGGAYTRHIVVAALLIAVLAALWMWLSGRG